MSFLKNYNDIDKEYIYTDKHIHSNWSDGESTIDQIAKQAKLKGLNHIAITDHVRADSTYYLQSLNQIEESNEKYKIEILPGYEAKIADFNGNIDVPADLVKRAKIRIASVHRFPLGGRLYYPNQFNKRICHEIELELSLAALRKKGFDILGHSGGMSLKTYNEFPVEFFEEIILECKKASIAFELNGLYHALIFDNLKRLLKKHNPLVSLGSEAHDFKDVGRCIEMFDKEVKV